MNYNVEEENTRKFKELCIEDESKVFCPIVIDELTTEKMLTMTYVDGCSIANVEKIDVDGYSREEIAKALIENYLHQVLDAGMFHADPHQGNILICDGIPCWIDFGMIGYVSDSCISTLQDVIFAIIQRNLDALADASLAIGRVNGKINRARLLEDLISVMKEHNITVSGEYTMLIRSLVTFEGVIEEFYPEQALFDFLVTKMRREPETALTSVKSSQLLYRQLRQRDSERLKCPVWYLMYCRILSRGELKSIWNCLVMTTLFPVSMRPSGI